MPVTLNLSGLKVFFGLFNFLFIEVLVETEELLFLNGLGATDKFGDVVKNGCIELEVFFLNEFDGISHFVFDFSDFLVPFVDGNGLDFLRERKFLDTFLNILKCDFTLTEKVEHFNKDFIINIKFG